MSTYLKGKHAAVFGASGGIGQATARKYVSAGVTALTLTYGNKQAEVEALAAELRETTGVKIYTFGHGDRMNPVQFEQDIAAAITANGQEIDVVADCVGWSPDTPLDKQMPELWMKVYQVNVIGCFVSIKIVADRMVAQGIDGRIVIVTSINGRRTFSSSSAPYDSSKAAQEAMVKNLGLHFAPQRVHVNGVAPGWVLTSMNETVTEADWAVEIPKIKSGRQAQPSEVASLIVSYSGEAADYLFGTITDIDGGYY